ncbi:MAG: formate dehydrogenase accessory sulfurtransferase FdhD [Lachnospiraceae bacterium]|nr:formate dehydrogenase accessory sulfurtransferase FdhD [Lachnospiraceae bacterium]MBR6357551.1 formate dehydrogenase accessory sulfurtransferase FdhD [Lachnospiraceae bacterium]MBR7076911.1 formate dehydrogenase accessory sulfurtransferase FdhD [Lachnospiraceae bacterium]
MIDNRFNGEEYTKEIRTRKYLPDGQELDAEKTVIMEHQMDLFVNEELAGRLVCVPEYLSEFVIGRLITEGFITDMDDVNKLYICEEASRARVFLNREIELIDSDRPEPTCCTGNRIYLKPSVTKTDKLPAHTWKADDVFRLCEHFAQDTELHRKTSGTHSCYLMYKGEIVFSASDIGRHNALDKAVGYAVINQLDRNACMLYTTGRVPIDMVEKAIMARIPVLVSKAVPTDKAIDLAKEYGITLIFSAWPDSFEICAE